MLPGDSSSETTNGGAQAPLICGARSCTTRHGRREALEAAVQADPGLRVTAVAIGWIPDDGEDGRLHELCYPWDQDTLGIAGHSTTRI